MRVKYTQTEELEIILETKGIEYQKEIVIFELDNKRFDYYLPEYNTFIEFDGAQHHYPVEHFGGNEAYIKQVRTDAEKTIWCYQNGYNFLRLNHLMSLSMINELIDYSFNIKTMNDKDLVNEEIDLIKEDTLEEYEKELPYIEEWSINNLNQRDLYINELFNNYNKLIRQVLGSKYKLKDKVKLEKYIKEYNNQIVDKGLVRRKKEYTKYYINEAISIEEANNIVDLFIKDLKEKNIFEYIYIPSKLLYEYYKSWLKKINYSSKPMKSREFNQKFNKRLRELNYNKNKSMRINSIKKYEFDSKLLMSANDLNPNNYNKSNYYNISQTNETTNVLINEDLFFKNKDVEEVIDILINTEKFDQLKEYPLPVIQYCIEDLYQTKPSLLANLESIDKMYLYTKDELIAKLNI